MIIKPDASSSAGGVRSVGVFYLHRVGNDPGLLRQFLKSYRQFPAGVDHDLIIIFKGYRDTEEHESERSLTQRLLQGIYYSSFECSDEGFDLTAYMKAAQSHSYDYFMFINSHSRLLEQDWLLKFIQHAQKPGIGVVAATGSWQSIRRDHALTALWRNLSKDWRLISTERLITRICNITLRALVLVYHSFLYAFYYPPFPNPHVRTNGFMASSDVLLKIDIAPLKKKRDAYRFESGCHSLTRQVQKMDLAVLVVGRDGRAYEIEEWKASRTFWASDQENLLLSDNQTRLYDDSDETKRRMLRQYAWSDPSC